MSLITLQVFSPDALAGSATDWQKNTNASVRLVIDTVKSRGAGEALVAGIEIKLDDGWKTYWRNPGDAGLPPTFNWSGSTNLKSARVLWPAPVRYRDSAGTSYGYKHEVVLPVVIEPEDPSQPVHLNLKLEYAVCADICIPAEAELSLKSAKDALFASSYEPLLNRYLSRVPVKLGPESKSGIAVDRLKAELSGKSPRLSFNVRIPGSASSVDAFLEGPEGFYLAPAERVAVKGDGTISFEVDLTKGDNPKGLDGKKITLTLVSDKASAELDWRVKQN